MGIRSEHEVEESAGRSAETRVEIEIGDVVGRISGEAIEPSSGVGDDSGDSDKWGAGSIRVGRWDVSAGEDEEDEVGIGVITCNFNMQLHYY